MGKWKTFNLHSEEWERLNALCAAFGKEKSKLVEELVNAVFRVWEDEIRRQIKKDDKLCLFWVMEVTREGKILIAPKLRAISKKVRMDSKPISVQEIEKSLEQNRGEDD